jgi:AAA+ ATPase superfamily predicted ATPase
MKVFIKILKFVAGTALGLLISFLIIVGLDAVISLDATKASQADLWLIGGVVSVFVFLCNYLFFIGSSSKKLHTKGIEDLPVNISEFIDEVIGAMKYRRSVRAEVRQELTDHFTDALAECETEEEKQKATQELIEEFGDIELLGKLLRRAKKRCRPLWRTMVARTLQFIGICFLLLILYIGWFFTGKPQVTTNYLEVLNQKVRPVAEESQNAWPYYKQAAEKYIEFEQPDDKDQWIDFSPRPINELTEKDMLAILQSLKDNQESLDLIRLGNQKPYYWRIYGTHNSDNQELISLLLPHLNEYRKLRERMCWQGLLNAEQGDFGKAFDDVLQCYSFGDHLRGQNTTLIEQLVAMSIESVSRDTLLMILAEYRGQIDVQILDSVRKRFGQMIENKNFTIDYKFEKMSMYDEAQRCFTQSRFGKSHLYLRRISQIQPMLNTFDEKEIISQWFHIIFTHPDREETLNQVEQLYSEMQKLSNMTPASVQSQGLDMNAVPLEVIENNVFLSVLMPALTKVNEIAWRVRTQACGTLTILAVLQYENEQGEYPESLDVLAEKELLKEVPIDPFSDKPLVYRKTDNDFILYSVGIDCTDNGGTKVEGRKGNRLNWREGGDGILWPVDIQ